MGIFMFVCLLFDLIFYLSFRSIDHFRITAIWPGDRIRQPEHPTENEVRRRS